LGCFRSYANFSFFAFILEDANALLKRFGKVNSVLAQMFRAERKAWLHITANELISNKRVSCVVGMHLSPSTKTKNAN